MYHIAYRDKHCSHRKETFCSIKKDLLRSFKMCNPFLTFLMNTCMVVSHYIKLAQSWSNFCSNHPWHKYQKNINVFSVSDKSVDFVEKWWAFVFFSHCCWIFITCVSPKWKCSREVFSKKYFHSISILTNNQFWFTTIKLDPNYFCVFDQFEVDVS